MIEGLRPYYNRTLKPVAFLVHRIGITPDMITIAGVFVFAVGAYLTAYGWLKIAVLVFLAGAALDGLDGVLARETGQKTLFGAILDSVCDRMTEILWIGGLVAYFILLPTIDFFAIFVSFAALTGSQMVSYVKARAEGAGVACIGGIMQRPERLIFLAIVQLTGNGEIIIWGLFVLAVAAYATVFQRMILVSRNAKKLQDTKEAPIAGITGYYL